MIFSSRSKANSKISRETSPKILVELVGKWFESSFAIQPSFRDLSLNNQPFPQTGEEVDVVFFGSFLLSACEILRWPKGNYRIWTMCQSSKNVLVELLGLPAACVTVIPRFEIIRPTKLKDIPKVGQKIKLLYGGRLSRSKNLPLLFAVVSEIQKIGIDIELTLIGSADADRRDDLGIEHSNEDFDAKECLNRLPWKSKPDLKTALMRRDWLLEIEKFDCLISLSTQYMEDFGLAAGEALEVGVPCLLSSWGGHHDYRGGGARFIDIPSNQEWGEAEEVPEGPRKIIANQIIAALGSPAVAVKMEADPKRQLKLPESFSKITLAEKIWSKGALSPECLLAPTRKSICEFARTEQGRKFFSEYREIFARG